MQHMKQRTIQLSVTDSGCQMGPNLRRHYPEISASSWAVGYMHGSAHIPYCQLANHAELADLLAVLAVGEIAEHLWAELKAVTKCPRSVAGPIGAANLASVHQWQI